MLHSQSSLTLASSPLGNQRSVVKFVASAQLKPWLNPVMVWQGEKIEESDQAPFEASHAFSELLIFWPLRRACFVWCVSNLPLCACVSDLRGRRPGR